MAPPPPQDRVLFPGKGYYTLSFLSYLPFTCSQSWRAWRWILVHVLWSQRGMQHPDCHAQNNLAVQGNVVSLYACDELILQYHKDDRLCIWLRLTLHHLNIPFCLSCSFSNTNAHSLEWLASFAPSLSCFCFPSFLSFLFMIEFHVAQAYLKVPMYSRLTLNFWSSCPHFLGNRTTGMH